ncbi:unnamed protein product [Amoebophrya sp. A25]|nr:unnamed protein product [Amoebophrya sp. A25]|eukprot:GSA25T00019073001.1
MNRGSAPGSARGKAKAASPKKKVTTTGGGASPTKRGASTGGGQQTSSLDQNTTALTGSINVDLQEQSHLQAEQGDLLDLSIASVSEEQRAEAVRSFTEALIRKYGSANEIFTRRFIEKVWEDITPGAAEISVKGRLLPWLTDRLGLSNEESRALVTVLDAPRRGVVPKTGFVTAVSTKIAGGNGSRAVTPSASPSRRTSRAGDVGGVGDVTQSSSKASTSVAGTNASKGTTSNVLAAPGGGSTGGSALAFSNSGGGSLAGKNPSAQQFGLTVNGAVPPAANLGATNLLLGSSGELLQSNSRDQLLNAGGDATAALGYPTLLASGGSAGSKELVPKLRGLGGQLGDSVIQEELEKMTSAGKIFESSQMKILEELQNIRLETERNRQKNTDISSKLRDVLYALDGTTSSTDGKGKQPSSSRGGVTDRSSATAKPGAALTTSAIGTTVNKSYQSTPRLPNTEQTSSSTVLKPELNGTMTSLKTDASSGGGNKSDAGSKSGTSDAAVKESAAKAEAASAAAAKENEEVVKQLEAMRNDLASLKQELASEINRREEAEIEAAHGSERLRAAEERKDRAEVEREQEQARAREMQRCLELLQEDMVRRTRATEVKYLEQERRMQAQRDMYAKMHRLQHILPSSIIKKSCEEDITGAGYQGYGM